LFKLSCTKQKHVGIIRGDATGLYVMTRNQAKALIATLELDGLE